MPPLTRWFIKSALLFLVAALLTGLLMIPRAAGAPWRAALAPVYYHLLMVGWATQLIFGVAHWLFPKHSRERPRGREGLGWASFALLNTGLPLRALAEPMQTASAAAGWRWLLAVSALLQWAAGLAFVAMIWGRVRGK